MRLRSILTAGAAVALAMGTAVVAAPSASALGAPIVWYQAVAVPSATAPCPVTSDAEKAKGWTAWTGSWAQWPNDGKGGFVCTRSITWAHEADTAGEAFPSAGCVLADSLYYQFGGGWSLPAGTFGWTNSSCTTLSGGYLLMNVVYAPTGYDATELCDRAWGSTSPFGPFGDGVYGCM